MHEAKAVRVRHVVGNDILTPRGLLIGKRFRRNGTTLIDYKSRGKHDMMTTKEVVECIEGIKIKDIIIIPEDTTPPLI